MFENFSSTSAKLAFQYQHMLAFRHNVKSKLSKINGLWQVEIVN